MSPVTRVLALSGGTRWVASMRDAVPILDADGVTAWSEGDIPAEGFVTVRLASGARLRVDTRALTAQPDGSYRIDLAFATLRVGANGEADVGADSRTLLEAEEALRVQKRVRETGRVIARKRVTDTQHIVDEPLWREQVTVERVPINRYVERPEPTREEEGVVIIPVYEEVLVVEKKLLLKEEVRLIRHRDEVRAPQTITVRVAQVEVERLPSATPMPDPQDT